MANRPASSERRPISCAVALGAALLVMGLVRAAAQGPAQIPAQAPPQAPALGESARELIGTWEFSTADRERTCSVTFKNERAGGGYRVEFEDKCAVVYPAVKDITNWTFPENDLLFLRDSAGRALIEFSEVESGIYEAPVAGHGVLFLQNAAAAGPPPPPPDQFAGDWAIVRGGKLLCSLSFTLNAADEGFAVAVKPGCDASLARLNFASWKIDRDELMLRPARGNAWRFEESENNIWSRVPEAPNPYTLVRQ